MIKDIVVLHWKSLTPSDNNARRIAELSGAEVTVVSLAAARDVESIKQCVPRCIALIVHIETLVQIAAELDTAVHGLLELTALAAHVFIYGIGQTDHHALVLQVLSLGSLIGVERLPTTDSTFANGVARSPDYPFEERTVEETLVLSTVCHARERLRWFEWQTGLSSSASITADPTCSLWPAVSWGTWTPRSPRR